MAQPRMLRVVVAAGEDVKAESAAVPRLLDDLGPQLGFKFHFYLWDIDALRDTDLDYTIDCDLLVCIFHRTVPSGKFEGELGWLLTHKKPVVLTYLKRITSPQTSKAATAQRNFIDRLQRLFVSEGFPPLSEYKNKTKFEHLFRRHATQFLQGSYDHPFLKPNDAAIAENFEILVGAPENFEIRFAPTLSKEQVTATLSALADYFRACGGVGLHSEFDLADVLVGEPEDALV